MKGYITRGHVDGTWYLRAELPRDTNGKQRQRRETVRGTKADAQRRLRDLLREVETARFVKSAKLPHVRFHDLRHSFGTLALASGVDLQTVSRALGHESVAITSRI